MSLDGALLSTRTALIPWLIEAPVGTRRLLLALHGKSDGNTVLRAKAS